jgi:uncharacterized membrane protein
MFIGIQHFMYVDFVITLIPEWIVGRRFWTYLTGTALIAAGTAITLDRTSRLAASLLGVMIFIFVLFVHVPAVLGRPNEPDQVTYLTQAFTFSGIAFLATAVVRQGQWPPPPFVDRVFAIGRWQVAIGFLVLGNPAVLPDAFRPPARARLVPGADRLGPPRRHASRRNWGRDNFQKRTRARGPPVGTFVDLPAAVPRAVAGDRSAQS